MADASSSAERTSSTTGHGPHQDLDQPPPAAVGGALDGDGALFHGERVRLHQALPFEQVLDLGSDVVVVAGDHPDHPAG